MATAKNFHETCAARGHAHADRRRGGAPQARIYIATLLLFLTTLGLLYVVLFVSGDSQPSLWAVMLLRILAFLLPVYLIVQARAAGRAPPQAPAPSGPPAARVPRRAGARRGPGPHRPRHPLASLLPVCLVVQARAAGRALTGPGTLWPSCCPCTSSCRRARTARCAGRAPAGPDGARARPRVCGCAACAAARGSAERLCALCTSLRGRLL